MTTTTPPMTVTTPTNLNNFLMDFLKYDRIGVYNIAFTTLIKNFIDIKISSGKELEELRFDLSTFTPYIINALDQIKESQKDVWEDKEEIFFKYCDNNFKSIILASSSSDTRKELMKSLTNLENSKKKTKSISDDIKHLRELTLLLNNVHYSDFLVFKFFQYSMIGLYKSYNVKSNENTI